MILVDTTVWVDYLHGAERAAGLEVLLDQDQVLTHPWVIGELAVGGIGPNREEILADLAKLPGAPVIRDEEVVELVSGRRLYGRGIGWVDAQLLASALVAGARLWTSDRRLAEVALGLGLSRGGPGADA
jgi:predicted nucleic acid-binding protein